MEGYSTRHGCKGVRVARGNRENVWGGESITAEMLRPQTLASRTQINGLLKGFSLNIPKRKGNGEGENGDKNHHLPILLVISINRRTRA